MLMFGILSTREVYRFIFAAKNTVYNVCFFFFLLYVYSVFGWDHVTQSLVQLGFILMDLFGPKAGHFGKITDIPNAIAKTPSQLTCKLGGQVLLESFKVLFYFAVFY